MKATATTPTISIADVLRALGKCATLLAIYALQRMAGVLAMARRFTLCACSWLASRHNFAGEEDPVVMTGWQYLGFGVIVFIVGMFLSINW